MVNKCFYFVIILSFFAFSIDNWLTYSDPQFRFGIDYSDEWAVQNDDAALAIFLFQHESNTDRFQENINVLIQDLSANPLDLDEYTELTKSQLINALGVNAVTKEFKTSINDRLFSGVEFSMPTILETGIHVNLKLKQVWTIVGNEAFVLTYTAENEVYDYYLTEVDHCFNSLKLMK